MFKKSFSKREQKSIVITSAGPIAQVRVRQVGGLSVRGQLHRLLKHVTARVTLVAVIVRVLVARQAVAAAERRAANLTLDDGVSSPQTR